MRNMALSTSAIRRTNLLRLLASYAGADETVVSDDMRIGGGLAGAMRAEKRRIVLTDVPSDYIRIRSGLGQARAAT